MIQRGKCPMCGGTMTEDSTHPLLVCDFCGNKEPLNYPVQNQTPNQGQYTNSSLQTTQHTYGNNSIQSTNTNGGQATKSGTNLNLGLLIILAVVFWPLAIVYVLLKVFKVIKFK